MHAIHKLSHYRALLRISVSSCMFLVAQLVLSWVLFGK